MQVTLRQLGSILGRGSDLSKSSHQILQQKEIGKPLDVNDAVLVIEGQESFAPVNVEGKLVDKEETQPVIDLNKPLRP